MTAGALLDGFRSALVVPLVAVVIALVVSATGLRRRTGEPPAEVGLAAPDAKAA